MIFSRLPARVACILSLSLALCGQGFSITDYNGNGYDDVWEALYNGTGLLPNDDTDGDGSPNWIEALAGTDPRNPHDTLKVGNVYISGSNIVLTVDSETGKKYQLRSSSAPQGPTWTNEGAPVTGDGTTKAFSTPTGGGPRKFYHILTQDQDTDNDGVTDWAEGKLGTDPALGTSASNASGGLANDGDTLHSLLSVTSSMVTADAFKKEATAARVRLTRSFGAMPLKVSFLLSGGLDTTKRPATTADYNLKDGANVPLTNSVTIANGATTADVVIQPKALINGVNEVPGVLAFNFVTQNVGPPVTIGSQTVRINDGANTSENQRLFVAYLGADNNVATTGSGVATILLKGDNTVGSVNATFNNLSSIQQNNYLKIKNPITGPEIQFIPKGQVTGAVWTIKATQFLTTDQAMLNALFQGKMYMSISTADFTNGELRGDFALSIGSISPPPAPAAPPAVGSAQFPLLTGSNLDRDIVRFLMQATFGPTPETIQEVKDLIAANGNNQIAGYTAWLNKQMDLAQAPSPSLLQLVTAADTEEFILRGNKPVTYSNDPQFGGNAKRWNTGTKAWDVDAIWQNNYGFQSNRRREWWTLVLQSKDQLRQRMAFALSQIVIISENNDSVNTYHYGAANYWDMLASNAFGSYRTILQNVTYSPMMGVYLSHLKNQAAKGTISPDENYAREIMQLFSIGLVQRFQDGSLQLDANGLPIPTYDQTDISELARVMTGLSFGKVQTSVPAATYPTATNQSIGTLVNNISFTAGSGHRYWQGPWLNNMAMFATNGLSGTSKTYYHDFNQKRLFNGKVGDTTLLARPTETTADGDADVTAALNVLAGTVGAGTYTGHSNTPVFVSRLLIQRFTTANPSAGYLYRVTQKYKDTNGNLGEVVKAILLDYEARSLALADENISAGKPKEPILHYISSLRALKAYTGSPLANLNTMPVSFSASESPYTTAYPGSELSKFPSGAVRFRYPDTTGNLSQAPQKNPSVFNWFLPDYVSPGALASAGLVAPELQQATESNVISTINYNYNLIFTTVPPVAAGVFAGTTVDNYFNMSGYQTGSGAQLSVPSYGVSAGYFSGSIFNTTTGQPDDLSLQKDNVIPNYTEFTTRYTNAYTAALGGVTTPSALQIQTAHAAAVSTVVDHLDLLLTGGYLKAKFGTSAGTPRQSILDGANAITTNYHTSDTRFPANALTRCRNMIYLVATSPQAMVLK
ncbi:hypothetical protein BH11VER1_BH11VER1_19220 [soil metagenome]